MPDATVPFRGEGAVIPNDIAITFSDGAIACLEFGRRAADVYYSQVGLQYIIQLVPDLLGPNVNRELKARHLAVGVGATVSAA